MLPDISTSDRIFSTHGRPVDIRPQARTWGLRSGGALKKYFFNVFFSFCLFLSSPETNEPFVFIVLLFSFQTFSVLYYNFSYLFFCGSSKIVSNHTSLTSLYFFLHTLEGFCFYFGFVVYTLRYLWLG